MAPADKTLVQNLDEVIKPIQSVDGAGSKIKPNRLDRVEPPGGPPSNFPTPWSP
jgi:hypothetical protein